MIKLTALSGEAEVFAPENIVRVKEDVSTRVYLVGGAYVVVNESYEEVVRKIMDYKLAMVHYTSGAQTALSYNAENGKNPFVPAVESWSELQRLAGLEQTP